MLGTRQYVPTIGVYGAKVLFSIGEPRPMCIRPIPNSEEAVSVIDKIVGSTRIHKNTHRHIDQHNLKSKVSCLNVKFIHLSCL